jgi:protein-disulfide isomerase
MSAAMRILVFVGATVAVSLWLIVTGPTVRAQSALPNALAEVNGEIITTEDLERALGTRLASLEEKIYALKQNELDALIGEKLLAQEALKRGVSMATLLDKEVTEKVTLVTEADVEEFYRTNKSSFGEESSAIRQQIRSYLQQQRLTTQRSRFVNILRSQAKVQVTLPPPEVHRVEIRMDGDLVRGAPDGMVSIVEFSDYHCPFCKRVQSTLSELLAKYPDKVRFVYRDFPLERLHPQAFRAAEAARCARDQGKFWEYHDVLFEQAPKATEDDLNRYAGQVGLDMKQFTGCLFQNVHHQAVQADLDEGNRLGLDGTPAFFINGRFLSGAQPIEAFVHVIDEELARAAAEGSVSAQIK